MIDPFLVLTPIFLLIILALLGFAGCTKFGVTPNVTQAATPTFSPPPGTYTSAQLVTISDATPGATIFFTTDGTDPVATAGGSTQQFGAPIKVAANMTVKAIATAPGFVASQVATGIYQIVITPIAFVNLSENDENFDNDRITTAAFKLPVTTGNLIVVWLWYNSAAQSVTSIADTAFNTYQRCLPPTLGAGGLATWQQELWYAKNIKAASNLTVTAIFSGTFSGEKAITAHEYQGLDQTTPLDTTASKTGVTANANCGALTVTAGELIFAAAVFKGMGSSGAGFSQRSMLKNNVTEDQLAPAAGPVTALFSNAAVDWIAQMVSFK
jgi:hypothetical protein